MSITNILSGTSVQIVSTLNNSSNNPRGHNSSPILTVEPTPFYCNLYLNCYNPGAVDLYDVDPLSEPSGDSLVFSLVSATNGTGGCGTIGGPVTYTGGTSPTSPLQITGGLSFDPTTGQMCFTPNAIQRSVVVYSIAEYLDDTLGVINTIAGTGAAGSTGDGGAALSALTNRPSGICVNPAGEVFFADYLNNKIRKIDLSGNIAIVAGNGSAGYSGDGGSALSAQLNKPMGISLDATGNLFVADMNNNVIRKVTPGGIITTVAGNGTAGFAGDGGTASSSTCELNHPVAVFADATGLYVSDTGNERIRRISPGGIITTICGTGTAGFSPDGTAAFAANINNPFGLYVAAGPTVYFAEAANNRIRVISSGGTIRTVAGTGVAGFGGDGGKAVAALLNHPTGVFLDNYHHILVADHGNNRIRIFDDTCGYISTMAGTGVPTFSGDGGAPAGAALDSLLFVVRDARENVFFADSKNNRIRKILRNANILKTQVGTMQREMNFLVTTCSYTAPYGKIDTGAGGGINRIDSTHYYGCANSGTFTLKLNPKEGDTSLHITVTATGLSPGFVFSVDSNNTNHPHVTIDGNTDVITPGNYTFYLTYTDNHCPLTGTVTVAFTVDILPVPTIATSLIAAATCSDSAQVRIIPGGTGKPWTVKLSMNLFGADTFRVFTFDTGAFNVNMAPGTYDITIFTSVSTDCAQNTRLVVDTSHFSITTEFKDPTYCGASDGRIVVHGLTPGHADSIYYKFLGVWQPAHGFLVPPAGTDTIFNLLAGVYDSVTVKEGLCFSAYTPPVSLTNPPFTARTVTGKNPTKCGFCDGVDTLWGLHPGQLDTIKYDFVPTGGGASTTFTLNHSIGLDSGVIISGLCGGSYSNVTINTAGLCTTVLPGPFIITAPGISANFDTAVHYGCNGDTIMFTNLSTPAPDLTYVWFFGDGGTGTQVNPSHVYTNTIASTVTIKLNVTNTKCNATFSLNKTFDNYIHGDFTMSPDQFVCQQTPVTLTNNSVGTNPTYTWIFGDGVTSNATNPVHLYTNTGQYTVQLVAASNMIPVPQFYTQCFDTVTKTISVDSNSAASINITDSVLCQGQGVTFTGIYSRIGDTSVSWSFGDGGVIFDQNPIMHSYDVLNNKTPFVVDLSVKYRACPDASASRTVLINAFPHIYLGPDQTMCPGGAPIKLEDDRNEKNPNARWRWNTTETGSSIMVVKPGVYTSTVTVDGCSTSDTVVVARDCYMEVPNVFSPNGDGNNDYFYPRQVLTQGLTSFTMQVYNRWGQLIFETHNIDGRGWDGMMNNTAQPEGVYIYSIDAKFKDGQVEHHTGNITLLR